MTLPVFLHELDPVEVVLFWSALPLLSSVFCLAKVFHLAVVRILMVEDHGYSALDLGCYVFGNVYLSDIARPSFVFFNCFLGIAHLCFGDPRIVFACPTFPFDKVIDYFVCFLSSSPTDRVGFRVEDLFDFELFFVIDQVGWRQWRDFLIREGRWNVRGQ